MIVNVIIYKTRSSFGFPARRIRHPFWARWENGRTHCGGKVPKGGAGLRVQMLRGAVQIGLHRNKMLAPLRIGELRLFKFGNSNVNTLPDANSGRRCRIITDAERASVKIVSEINRLRSSRKYSRFELPFSASSSITSIISWTGLLLRKMQHFHPRQQSTLKACIGRAKVSLPGVISNLMQACCKLVMEAECK